MHTSWSERLGEAAYWARRLGERAVKRLGFAWVGPYAAARPPRPPRSGEPRQVAIICEELFQADLGGLGGYGKTVRRLTSHYRNGADLVMEAVVPRDIGLARRPARVAAAGTRPLFLPSLPRLFAHRGDLIREIGRLEPLAFLSIDYQVHYEYVLWAAPRTPLIVYLRIPRSEVDWDRLANVPGELVFNRRPSRRALRDIARQQCESFDRVRRWSHRYGRPIIFATNARCLVERARLKLRLDSIEAYDLPNPVPLPKTLGHRSEQPTLLWLGRLDPQKRPWVALELARRLPDVRFVVAGQLRRPEQTEPLLAPARELPNVALVGHVEGPRKQTLLGEAWALLNTSLHEGLPVTFLEAFSYGKPVISSVDPDGLVSRFGYVAAVPETDGLDPDTIDGYANAIRASLSDSAGEKKGLAARQFVAEGHSFESFDRHLRRLLAAEGLG